MLPQFEEPGDLPTHWDLLVPPIIDAVNRTSWAVMSLLSYVGHNDQLYDYMTVYPEQPTPVGDVLFKTLLDVTVDTLDFVLVDVHPIVET